MTIWDPSEYASSYNRQGHRASLTKQLPNELLTCRELVGMWSLSDVRKHCWLELTILCRFRHSPGARRAA